MNRFTSMVVGLGMAVAMQAAAQQADDAQTGDRRPPRGESRQGKTETLTTAQKAQVKRILAKYDASTLTAAQAKAIHEAFRQAGLRGGPAMNDTVKAAGFDSDKLRDLDPPPGQAGGKEQRTSGRGKDAAGGGGNPPPDDNQPAGAGERQREDAPAAGGSGGDEQRSQKGPGQDQYSLTQAVSEEAQLHTIAFSGLAFITGDFGGDTFIPPGKVCDFFGFQYMRDIDAAKKGHNPMFLDRVAGNVLSVLDERQRALFAASSKRESAQLQLLAMKRLPLIKAFCRELAGELPAGSRGLNRESVIQYVGDIFAFDAELSYLRAQVFGQIVASFTPAQKAYLAKMKFGDFNSWPAVEMDKYKLPRGTEKSVNVAYMTHASEFFSWYAGSVEADTYFCPERHGTYFGGFYMKDMPAMGKRDYDISTSLTGDSGKEFLETLNADQRTHITAIPDQQAKVLQEVIEVRRAISTELRKFLKGGAADKAKLLALGRRYGELDGEMSWLYATAFAKANRTLTDAQRKTLVKLRNLDGYTSAPAYLYSTPVKEAVKLPDTDHFFFPPKAASGSAK